MCTEMERERGVARALILSVTDSGLLLTSETFLTCF